MLQQQFRHSAIVLDYRVSQRRGSGLRMPRVHVRAVLDQHLGDLEIAGPRRVVQRRRAQRVARV